MLNMSKVLPIFILIVLSSLVVTTSESVDITLNINNHSQQAGLNWSQAGHIIDTNITPTSDNQISLGDKVARWFKGWFGTGGVETATANVTGNLYVGSNTVNTWMYNQTTPAKTYTDTRFNNNDSRYASTYNSSYLTSSNNATYNLWAYNQTTAATSQQGTFSVSNSDKLDNLHSSSFFPYNTSVTSSTNQFDFNGGWVGNGLSIINGDLYAKTVYLVNFSALNVGILNTNGSILPTLDNQFNLGSGSYRWKDLYISGNVNISGVNVNQYLYNQTTPAQTYTNNQIANNDSRWTTTYNVSYLTSSYNATYTLWAYNQTYTGGTYNASYAGLINNASYLSTYNVSYDGLLNNASYLSTYNISYAGSLNNASYLSTYNSSYLTSSYNVTYASWAYNQTYTGGTYNATYALWSYNQTYSGSTFNSTYALYAYNQTSAVNLGTYLQNNSNVYFTKVGIGTNDSPSDLEIRGVNPVLGLVDTNSGAAPAGNYLFQSSNDALKIFRGVLGVSADEVWEMNASQMTARDFGVKTTSLGIFSGPNLIYFPRSGNSYIANGGNLGIGTSTPAYVLQINNLTNALNVSGTLFVNGTNVGIGVFTNPNATTNRPLTIASAKGAVIGLVNSTYNPQANSELGRVDFGAGAYSNAATVPYEYPARIVAVSESFWSTAPPTVYDVSGQLQFQTLTATTVAGNDAAVPTTKMTITGAGSVGIGTKTPSGKLDIHGDGATTGIAFQVANSSGAGRFTVQDNGNVIIGAAGTQNSALTMYSVGGAGAVTGTISTQAYGFMISSTAWSSLIAPSGMEHRTNGYVYYQNSTGSSKATIYGMTGDFATNGQITSNGIGTNYFMGKVGIGTFTPTYPLEVGSNVSGISIYAQANISATGYLTRTSNYDKSKGEASLYIQDSSYYLKEDGSIDHTKFYGFTEYDKTDLTRPVNEIKTQQECHTEPIKEAEEALDGNLNGTLEETIEEANPKTQEICKDVQITVTTYPYTVKEQAVNLESEINMLRQALYDTQKEICEKDSSYTWCAKYKL